MYQLDNKDQVIESTLYMIEKAKHVVLGDIEPKAMKYFEKALVAAAARGVKLELKYTSKYHYLAFI